MNILPLHIRYSFDYKNRCCRCNSPSAFDSAQTVYTMDVTCTKKLLVAAFFHLLATFFLCAQMLANNPWQDVKESAIPAPFAGARLAAKSADHQVSSYRTLKLNLEALQNLLEEAPMRFSEAAKAAQPKLAVPMPGGDFTTFSVVEAPVMHPELADKFPYIRSYAGWSKEDPTAYLRCGITQNGFHAVVFSNRHSTVFIDAYSKGDDQHYICYFKKDFNKNETFQCEVEGTASGNQSRLSGPLNNPKSLLAGDCKHRTYALALACTGEYAQYHGGTVPLVMAEFNVAMTRVNGVYEKNFAVTMQMVANNNLLVYLDGATDPFDNGNSSTIIGQNHNNCNSVIGSANYDIGHVFMVGGGGRAFLNAVCSNNNKGRGCSGINNPVGDPFYIDYVCHEMGHQFGANHTQNNNCSSVSATSMEPGSGSTIMGYAGICPPNVQNNSDDYFHAVSLAEISSHITGNGNACATTLITGNSAPTVTVAATSYTLPISTPFVLTANATDPDGDVLSYCWEQMNPQAATMPPLSTNTSGPAFRSLKPVESNSRYFPSLDILLFSAPATWEVLPSVGRTMNFRCTVRDNHPGAGCSSEANVALTFTASAGPFVVTYPNLSSVVWNVSELQTVTWNVANTNVAPVNASHVDILLSVDGGQTYPYTLLSNTPNDGSADVFVPSAVTSKARIMVKGSNNVFFDISNDNFTIQQPPFPTFTLLATPDSQAVCINEVAVYNVEVKPVLNYSDPLLLTATGAPAGAVVTFVPPVVTPPGTSIMTVNSHGSTTLPSPGTYTITITASNIAMSKSVEVKLTLQDSLKQQVMLLSPADGAKDVPLNPLLTWQAVQGADYYVVQVSKNPSFVPLLESATVSTNSYQTTQVNNLAGVYYWRVKAVNHCNETAWSKTWAFQTDNEGCVTLTSPSVPVAIPDNAIDTVYATITSNVDFSLNKIQTHLNISHDWVGDLRARIISPMGTSRLLFDQPGVPASQYGCSEDHIIASFYDTAPNTAVDFENTCNTTVPAISGDFQPVEPFSALLSGPPIGIWTLEIADYFPEDGGSVNVWTLELCGEKTIDPVNLLVNNPLTVPQNFCETITNAYLQASGTPANLTFVLLSVPTNGALLLMGDTLSVGETFTQQDIDNGKLSYCHNSTNTNPDQFTFDVLNTGNGWLYNQVFNLNILPNNLSATAALTQGISCNNANNAQINVTATGGYPPYMYSLNGGTFQTGNVFNNLAAGTYTVTVKDNTGFTKTTNSITVTNPPVLNVSATANGNSIIVTANGGTPPYMYSIDGANFQSGNIFNNMPNGTYTVTVKDANGCTKTTIVVVAVNTLAATATVTQQISCFGGNNGIITVTAAGGTPPYTYSLNGGLFQSSNVFANLPAGSYVVTVMDVNGFTINTNPVTLSNPPNINVSASVSGNTITVTASGGTGSLTYSIDGVNFQASNVFTNLPNGTYTITVKDANGCTKTTTAVVSVTLLSATSVISQNISCNGGSDGKITATASGGTAPYTYSLNGGAFQSNNMFSNLPAGTYTVTVKDANGTTVNTNSVTLTNPPPLSVSATVVANSIIVMAGGGTPPYTYSIDGVNFQASNTFNNLPNGVYTVTVKDQNGCINTTTAVVAINTLVASASISKNISCAGSNDGQITVIAGGGTPPYTYSLNGGPFQSNNVFSNLGAGTYSVTVKDNDGFTVTTNNVTLTSPPALNVSASVSGNTITVTASGGTGSLTYSINGVNFQMENEFENVPNGTYTVTVKDANGCTKTTTAVVSVNMMSATAAIAQFISCAGGNNGSITVNVSGGSPPYQYSLNGGAYQNNNVFSNLPAGTYVVTVKDNNGFTVSTNQVTLTEPPAITVSAIVIDDDITVVANGGTGTLTYSIDGVNYQASNLFNNLANGVYTVSVKDSNGCIKTTTAVIAVNSLLVSATVLNDISCFGGNDGAIVVTVGGGTPPYQYSLNGGIVQMSNIFYNLPSGTYTIIVTDNNGQTAAANTIILNNPPPLVVNLNVTGYTVVVNASGGTGTLQYSIDGSPFQFGNTFFPIPNGLHTIKVKDGKGCEMTAQATVNVPVLEVSAAITQAILCNSAGGTITATASGGLQPWQFSLNGGIFQNNNVFSNLPPGTYWVTVLDVGGFTATSTSVLLTSPPPLTASGSVVGYNVTITASGGVAPYQYSLDGGAFQSSNVFPNLANGSYVVTVLDANGCTTQINVTVSIAPLQLSASLESAITCYDSTNAVIIAVVSGGAPPFQFSLNGGAYQNGNVFSNLGAGSYTVVVKDAGGITATAPAIIVNSPPPITVSASVFGPDITVAASGGTGLLKYSIDGVNFQSSNKLTTSFNGVFTVTVMDANGCIKTTSVTVNAPREVAHEIVHVSCHGANDGIIEINGVTGGIPPYLFSLDGSAFTSALVYANLLPGNHTLIVQDMTGYQWTAPVIAVTEPSVLTFQTETDGTKLVLHASGGTGPYQYSIDGGLTFQADSTFTNLSGGVYQVVVKDMNGCTASATVTITSSKEELRHLTFELFPNPNDGLFTVKMTVGSSGRFRFVWYDVMGRIAFETQLDLQAGLNAHSFDLLFLPAGVYQLHISQGDARGLIRMVIVR